MFTWTIILISQNSHVMTVKVKDSHGIILLYCNNICVLKSTVTRLGRWIDFDNDYKTLYPQFMESVW